jgi:hypothetical protein
MNQTFAPILCALALGFATMAATAKAPSNEEPVSGVRYHVAGFSKDYDKAAARADAWTRAVAECDGRAGYMTEFNLGSTLYAGHAASGSVEHAYATCRTDQPVATDEDLILDDILPETHVSTRPRLQLQARGSLRTAYLSVREEARSACRKRGQQVEQMSLGFYTMHGQSNVTAYLDCTTPARPTP